MKKFFLLATFATLTWSAQAQQTRNAPKEDRQEMRQKMTPDERTNRQAQMMQKRLKLTDAQTDKIRDINVKTMLDKSHMTEDREALRQDRMEMMKKREAMYSQVLTKEQMTQFQTLKEARVEKIKEHHADRKKGRDYRLNPEVKEVK